MKEQPVLRWLLFWLAVYVMLHIGISLYAGKAADALSTTNSLISGFAGAAFTMMRLTGEKGSGRNDENSSNSNSAGDPPPASK